MDILQADSSLLYARTLSLTTPYSWTLCISTAALYYTLLMKLHVFKLLVGYRIYLQGTPGTPYGPAGSIRTLDHQTLSLTTLARTSSVRNFAKMLPH